MRLPCLQESPLPPGGTLFPLFGPSVKCHMVFVHKCSCCRDHVQGFTLGLQVTYLEQQTMYAEIKSLKLTLLKLKSTLLKVKTFAIPMMPHRSG